MSKAFGSKLRAYRTMLGMTQLDLAENVGLTRSAVNNYEAGKSEPNFQTLCRFANVLGVDLSDLLSLDNDIPDYCRRVLVTEQEWFLLDIFRKADPTYQGVAIDILRAHQNGGDR